MLKPILYGILCLSTLYISNTIVKKYSNHYIKYAKINNIKLNNFNLVSFVIFLLNYKKVEKLRCKKIVVSGFSSLKKLDYTGNFPPKIYKNLDYLSLKLNSESSINYTIDIRNLEIYCNTIIFNYISDKLEKLIIVANKIVTDRIYIYPNLKSLELISSSNFVLLTSKLEYLRCNQAIWNNYKSIYTLEIVNYSNKIKLRYFNNLHTIKIYNPKNKIIINQCPSIKYIYIISDNIDLVLKNVDNIEIIYFKCSKSFKYTIDKLSDINLIQII
jgi:hypothetical protein